MLISSYCFLFFIIIVTYLGALILPIKPKASDIMQHKKYTSIFNPH